MIHQQLKTGIDIGSKDTKVYSINLGKRLITKNCILPISMEQDMTDYYTDGNDDKNLDITIKKISGDPIKLYLGEPDETNEKMEERYLVAGIAEQYKTLLTRPVSTKPKTFQQTTYVNIFANLILQMRECDFNEAVVFAGLLLPPREYLDKEVKELFESNIAGTYKITTNSDEEEYLLEIPKTNIIVYSECAASLATFLFDINGKMREDAIKYSEGKVVAIDFGRSTTDIAIIDKSSPVVGSYHTVSFGGEKMLDVLADRIMKTFRANKPGDDILETALETGYWKRGASSVSVHELVQEAKIEVAQAFYKEFSAYMHMKGYNFQDIEALLFVGGGSLPTLDEQVPSIGKYLMILYNQVSQDTDDLYLEDPRFANLEGIRRMLKAHGIF